MGVKLLLKENPDPLYPDESLLPYTKKRPSHILGQLKYPCNTGEKTALNILISRCHSRDSKIYCISIQSANNTLAAFPHQNTSF